MNDQGKTESPTEDGRSSPASVLPGPQVITAPAPKTGKPGVESPVILPGADEASRPLAPKGAGAPAPPQVAQAQVTVAPNLTDIITGRIETPADMREAKEKHDLNEVVHQVLIIGLAVSSILMLTGLGLDIFRRHELPTAVPDFRDVFSRVAALRPSGFLALGLLVLVATPILRVIGSIFAFLYERDWRYAGITLLVLVIVMISLLVGKG